MVTFIIITVRTKVNEKYVCITTSLHCNTEILFLKEVVVKINALQCLQKYVLTYVIKVFNTAKWGDPMYYSTHAIHICINRANIILQSK